MSRSVRARWWNASVVVAVAILLAVACILADAPFVAVALAVGAAPLAWSVSPLRRVRGVTGHWDAQALLVREGSPIIYWRPGCFACVLLRLALGPRAKAATWVDVWEDPAGAAFVRDVNGGTETVPTVILRDGSSVTNSAPELVLEDLAA